MKVLVIGAGGREHALAWKLAQSLRVSEVLVAPGNAGTAREAKCRNVEIAATDLDALLELAQTQNIGLTVVGPEAPLVAGICSAPFLAFPRYRARIAMFVALAIVGALLAAVSTLNRF